MATSASEGFLALSALSCRLQTRGCYWDSTGLPIKRRQHSLVHLEESIAQMRISSFFSCGSAYHAQSGKMCSHAHSCIVPWEKSNNACSLHWRALKSPLRANHPLPTRPLARFLRLPQRCHRNLMALERETALASIRQPAMRQAHQSRCWMACLAEEPGYQPLALSLPWRSVAYRPWPHWLARVFRLARRIVPSGGHRTRRNRRVTK